MPETDWDKAGGVSCQNCGQETLRLLPLPDGRRGCPSCAYKLALQSAEREGEQQQWRRAKRLLREGVLSLRDLRESRI